MSFSAHSAFLCDRLLNMFCSAAYKSVPPFGHIKVELCPGLESNSWTNSAKPQCLSSIILFVLLYRNHRFYGLSLLLSYIYLLFSLCRVSICEIRNIIRKPTAFSLNTELQGVSDAKQIILMVKDKQIPCKYCNYRC